MAHAWRIGYRIIGFNLDEPEEVLFLNAYLIVRDALRLDEPWMKDFEDFFLNQGKGLTEKALNIVNDHLERAGKGSACFCPKPSGKTAFMQNRGLVKVEARRRIIEDLLDKRTAGAMLERSREECRLMPEVAAADLDEQDELFQDWETRAGQSAGSSRASLPSLRPIPRLADPAFLDRLKSSGGIDRTEGQETLYAHRDRSELGGPQQGNPKQGSLELGGRAFAGTKDADSGGSTIEQDPGLGTLNGTPAGGGVSEMSGRRSSEIENGASVGAAHRNVALQHVGDEGSIPSADLHQRQILDNNGPRQAGLPVSLDIPGLGEQPDIGDAFPFPRDPQFDRKFPSGAPASLENNPAKPQTAVDVLLRIEQRLMVLDRIEQQIEELLEWKRSENVGRQGRRN